MCVPLTWKRPVVTADRRMITTTQQPTENSVCLTRSWTRCCEPTHRVRALPGCSHNRQTSPAFSSVVFAKQFVRRPKKKAEQLKRASLFPPDGDYNVFLNKSAKNRQQGSGTRHSETAEPTNNAVFCLSILIIEKDSSLWLKANKEFPLLFLWWD